MEHREQEPVETLKGVGRIWHNGKVAAEQTRYRIDISRTIHVTRTLDATTQRTPGLGTIEGNLLSEVPWELIGESIELELQDGRRWKCGVQSARGDLVNMGGIA